MGIGTNATSCYNIGVINGKTTSYAVGNGTLSNCYYLGNRGIGVSGATSLTPEQMEQQSSFNGFNFGVWTMAGIVAQTAGYLTTSPDQIYPQVVRLKEEGWHLYIVSNCQKGYIEDFLHAADAESLIEDHLCYEDTEQEKDYNIRLCTQRNELDYAMYVGDTAGDLQSAVKAGTDFVFASYGFGDVTGMEGVKGEISSFAQLPQIAGQIMAGKE